MMRNMNIRAALRKLECKLTGKCTKKGAWHLELSEPTSKRRIAELEKKIGVRFPEVIREFISVHGELFSLSWEAKESLLEQLPDYMEELVGGYFDFDVKNLVFDFDGWKFPDVPYSIEDKSQVLNASNLFPFIDLMNGDRLVVVTEGEFWGQVFYLNHEGSRTIDFRLSENVEQLMQILVQLAFPDLECWMIKCFHDSDLDRLSLDLKSSQLWRKILDTTDVGKVPC